MQKILLLLAITLFTSTANAVPCTGIITEILTWEGNCQVTDSSGVSVSHIGFKTSGMNSKWVCSKNDLTDSAVMLAYANKIPVEVDTPLACNSIVNFTPVNWLRVKPF